ncbi:transglycosylase domain-containing protein [Bacillus alkalisoli]|uniref:transglycosylase domain-containing protein n=1 Tax=Bacillus alkalisoli TaxID=2011008 RepID=UPI000C23A2D2|nr:PBP1A family penicillin-binding protein [Bacillus alkalisoli]
MSEKNNSREARRKALVAEKAKNGGSKKKKVSSILKKVILIGFLLGLAGLLVGVATFAYYVKDTPPLDETLLKVAVRSTVMDKDGELAAELGSHEAREVVSFNDIPQEVIDAFLATEDVRFFEHNGVDYRRLAGAVVANITGGFGAQGGSTITQQLVKLSFLTEEKTLRRKAQEFYLAYQLEGRFSKEEILEMYLNKIFFSNRSYGIQTAAQNYYGKELDELELHEIAMLAGLPQSPNPYNPKRNPENAERRRNVVLHLMVMHGKITEAEAEEARNVPVTETLVEGSETNRYANRYDAFIDRVVDEISEKLGEQINPNTDGLQIFTTLDQNAQQHVELLISDESPVKHKDNEDYQIGITLLDTKSGAIRAIGGARNYVKTGTNYATDEPIQPGSAIKPILDYGPAIEHLQWSTYHQINDEAHNYTEGEKNAIRNWDDNFKGWMSMRQHIVESRNVPAVKALQEVGKEKARDFATKIGVSIPENYTEAYSLGGFSSGTTTLELAGAFASFGNEGVYTEPYAVTKVVFPDGTTVNLNNQPEIAMKDSTAFMITDMLKSALRDPGNVAGSANVPGLNVAGKSGTTNFDAQTRERLNHPSGAVPSVIFSGYTPTYTAAIWAGFKRMGTDNYLRSQEERRAARDLFKNLISHVSTKDADKADFRVPNSVVRVAIEKGSNPPLLASEFTPKDKITNEYFIRGTEPTKVSTEFERLDAPSGLTVVYDEEKDEVLVNWQYDGSLLDKVSFEVKATVNDGNAQILTVTKDLGVIIESPQPGSRIKVEVTALLTEAEEKRSETSTQTVNIPELVEEEEEIIIEIPDPLPPPDDDEDDDDDDDDDDDTNEENTNRNNRRNNDNDDDDDE